MAFFQIRKFCYTLCDEGKGIEIGSTVQSIAMDSISICVRTGTIVDPFESRIRGKMEASLIRDKETMCELR